MIQFKRKTCGDLEAALHREWLETNGSLALPRQQSLGLANFNFYKLAAQDSLANCNSSKLVDPTKPSSCSFQDLTLGNNAVPGLPGYPAKTGYDLSTGLGTLNAENIVKAWPTAQKLASITAMASGPISARHGQPVPISVTVKPKAGNGAPSGALDLITDEFGSVFAGTLSNGSFSGNVANLPGGQYTAKVHYSGDAMFSPSNSGSVAVNITPRQIRKSVLLRKTLPTCSWFVPPRVYSLRKHLF